MKIKVALPDRLPSDGFAIELRFRRIPAYSAVLRATLNAAPGATEESATVAHIYGRGLGSEAREELRLVLHFSAQVVTARGVDHDNVLILVVEDLAGQPVARDFLELLGTEIY